MTKNKYTSYAENVINGKVIAGELIKLACKRYLSFFSRDDMYFDEKAADRVVNFIGKLKHFTGIHNRKPFILEEWQKWLIYSMYGFKWKKDDTRVCRTAYIEVGRKNGKTALISALCLYHLTQVSEVKLTYII